MILVLDVWSDFCNVPGMEKENSYFSVKWQTACQTSDSRQIWSWLNWKNDDLLNLEYRAPELWGTQLDHVRFLSSWNEK